MKLTHFAYIVIINFGIALELFEWDAPGIGRNIVFMLAIGGLSLIILMLIEYSILSAIVYWIREGACFESKTISQHTSPIDSDVADEMAYVAAIKNIDIESHSLVVKSVSKMYGPFLAVNQLSFKVDQ